MWDDLVCACLCVSVQQLLCKDKPEKKDGERSDERFTWAEIDLEETKKKENH